MLSLDGSMVHRLRSTVDRPQLWSTVVQKSRGYHSKDGNATVKIIKKVVRWFFLWNDGLEHSNKSKCLSQDRSDGKDLSFLLRS